MEADEAVRIVDAIEATGVEAWLDGGRGVDALLEGQTRPHDLEALRERFGAEIG